jgi:hypothetical protein
MMPQQRFFVKFSDCRMNEFLKVFTVFLTCMFLFGKAGIPTAIVFFKFNFVKVMLISWAGGISGIILFTYMSEALIKGIHKFRVKRHLIHRKRIFTRFNRRIIRVKQRFGLSGIAFITPIIGTPVGSFIAERFYKNKRKVIVYLSISIIFWSLLLYFIILIFYDRVKVWLL